MKKKTILPSLEEMTVSPMFLPTANNEQEAKMVRNIAYADFMSTDKTKIDSRYARRRYRQMRKWVKKGRPVLILNR